MLRCERWALFRSVARPSTSQLVILRLGVLAEMIDAKYQDAAASRELFQDIHDRMTNGGVAFLADLAIAGGGLELIRT
jgi:hypothetical protein